MRDKNKECPRHSMAQARAAVHYARAGATGHFTCVNVFECMGWLAQVDKTAHACLAASMLFMSLQSLLELYVNITDYDSIGDNDTVDDITIPLSGQLEADSLFSLSKTYSGSCGRASLAVKFRLTSLCPTNQYGPQCDKECIEEPQQTLCNYLGESVDLCPNGDTTECRCEGHFLEPNCILCDEDYYLAGECDVFCSPSDSDYRGHYRCNPETGEKVCLEGYKDPSTSCVDEDENHGQFLE